MVVGASINSTEEARSNGISFTYFEPPGYPRVFSPLVVPTTGGSLMSVHAPKIVPGMETYLCQIAGQVTVVGFFDNSTSSIKCILPPESALPFSKGSWHLAAGGDIFVGADIWTRRPISMLELDESATAAGTATTLPRPTTATTTTAAAGGSHGGAVQDKRHADYHSLMRQAHIARKKRWSEYMLLQVGSNEQQQASDHTRGQQRAGAGGKGQSETWIRQRQAINHRQHGLGHGRQKGEQGTLQPPISPGPPTPVRPIRGSVLTPPRESNPPAPSHLAWWESRQELNGLPYNAPNKKSPVAGDTGTLQRTQLQGCRERRPGLAALHMVPQQTHKGGAPHGAGGNRRSLRWTTAGQTRSCRADKSDARLMAYYAMAGGYNAIWRKFLI